MIGIFSVLATPLGMLMNWAHMLIQNYGWTIIIFTLFIKSLMIPLNLHQQKSMAKTSAYQPMIQEIQKKWASDKTRQNEELQKFYDENNIKMSAGCLPMALNTLVLFSMIAVVQAPLTYTIRMPEKQVENATAIVQKMTPELNVEKAGYSAQSIIIGEIKNPEKRAIFIEGMEITKEGSAKELVKVEPEWVKKVEEFDFNFFGMDLSRVPTKVPTDQRVLYFIIPIISALTMFGSQFAVMKLSPAAAGQQQTKGPMMIMTLVMGVWFSYISFTIPLAFSLYYSISNITNVLQQVLVRKLHDPEKAKQKILEEIEEKRKAKKAKKKIEIKDEKGKLIQKEVTEAELAKIRILKAREQDESKYIAGEEEDEGGDFSLEAAENTDENRKRLERAKRLDEQKYSG